MAPTVLRTVDDTAVASSVLSIKYIVPVHAPVTTEVEEQQPEPSAVAALDLLRSMCAVTVSRATWRCRCWRSALVHESAPSNAA